MQFGSLHDLEVNIRHLCHLMLQATATLFAFPLMDLYRYYLKNNDVFQMNTHPRQFATCGPCCIEQFIDVIGADVVVTAVSYTFSLIPSQRLSIL